MNLELVVKLNNYCNLACDYCYFEAGLAAGLGVVRQSMPSIVVDLLVDRVREAVATRTIDSVSIIYHGGEPLMYSKTAFQRIHTRVRQSIGDFVNSFTLQTNGTLLDEEWIDIFIEGEVGLGISLDGDESNNGRRLDGRSRSSHTRVIRAVQKCVSAAERGLVWSVLAVVSQSTAPDVLHYFRQLGVTALDLLPIQGVVTASDQEYIGETLAALFKAWYDDTTLPSVRLFNSIVSMNVGGPPLCDSTGGDHAEILTIYPDGRIGVADSLAVHGHEFGPQQHLSSTTLQDFMTGPSATAVRTARRSIPDECFGCRHQFVCRGGYLPDRYRERTFQNRSSNCRSMLRFLDGVDVLLYGRSATS